MRLQTLGLMLLVLLCMAIIPVQAQTITMANPGGIAERDIAVYWYNGSLQGYYNSTSVITLDGSNDYIFTLKPIASNPLDDPSDWFSNTFMPFIKSNALVIVVLVFLAGLWWRGR